MSAKISTEKQIAETYGAWQRNLNTIYIVWLRDILRHLRDHTRIVTSLMQPLMFLFIIGSGLRNSLGAMGTTRLTSVGVPLDFRTFLFPGVLSMAVLFTAISSAISIVWDREFGFLREMLVAPISRASIVIGKALGGSTVAAFQGTILLIFAPLMGVSLTPELVIKLVLEMFLLAFCLTCLGIAIASRMKSMEGFQMISQFLLQPMFLLSGILFPLRGLPAWLAFLNSIDPVSYGVDSLRQTVLNTLNLSDIAKHTLDPGITIFNYTLSTSVELGVVVILGIIFMIWAVVLFSRQD
jgi:ABC-2 type transport system permease protein